MTKAKTAARKTAARQKYRSEKSWLNELPSQVGKSRIGRAGISAWPVCRKIHAAIAIRKDYAATAAARVASSGQAQR